jgi:hypothetical protein
MATSTKQKSGTSADQAFLGLFRQGMGAVEKTGLSAMEIPFTVLSGLGVSAETTEGVREGTQKMATGITGTIDSIATGSVKVAKDGFSLVTGAFASVVKTK